MGEEDREKKWFRMFLYLSNKILFNVAHFNRWASLVAQSVKNLPAMQEIQVQSLGWEDPLEKKWQPTPVSLPGKSHGWRSLVGYSPWGHKELDTTEQLHFHIPHSLDIFFTLTIHNKDGYPLA